MGRTSWEGPENDSNGACDHEVQTSDTTESADGGSLYPRLFFFFRAWESCYGGI